MRLKNRLLILGIWLGAAMMALAACGGEPERVQTQEATVTVQEIVNRVEVNTLHLETNELAFVDLQLGQSLQTGNLVKTYENSSARIDISIQDFTRVSRTASKTIWRLGGFALNGEAVIELQEGKIFVFDEDHGQESWPLHIVTPAGTASARGTWMSVEYDPESGTVEVECLRGICEMENDLGYQVFTNEQTVAATAVTVPTEPAPMAPLQIEAFHELPEVLTEEMPIPVLFTPAEAQAKLEEARSAAVRRKALEEERKIDSARVSAIIETARAWEQAAATGINRLGEKTDSIGQTTTGRGLMESDTASNELSEPQQEVASLQPKGLDEAAGATGDGGESVAIATEEPAIAEDAALALAAQPLAVGNTVPVAEYDTATTVRDVAISVSVLGNDSDADNDILSVTNLTQPSIGTAVVNGDNTILYTPGPGFTGVDSFTYTANDGMDNSNIATVTFTVAEPGQAVPVAVDDTGSGAIKISIDMLQNDSDADGDALTVAILTQPSNGKVTLNPDNTVVYTPDSAFFGVDTFTYMANDGTFDSNIATVSVTVDSVPVAIDDTASTLIGVAVTIDVLQNDMDADTDSLSVNNLTQPSNGKAKLNGDDTVLYTPVPGFTGMDIFTYSADNGNYNSNIAIVMVTVAEPVTVVPVALDDTASTLMDMTITIDVLQNDTDADGGPLTVNNLSQPSNGTAALNGDNTVLYTPSSGFAGLDTFTYTANDGMDDSSAATVTVTVS